jgi:hypothetical protein
MPLHDGFEQSDWEAFIAEVDWRLTTAIERVLAPRPTKEALDAIAAGFNVLQNGLTSRDAQEADYQDLGITLAYTFKFMPQRVSSVAAALTLMARLGCDVPHRILDIGSGTDATRVALDLSVPSAERDGSPNLTLVTVEPSYAMQNFGKTIAVGPGLTTGTITRYMGGFDYESCALAGSDRFEMERDFDCIVLSACLPYGLPASDMYWNALSRSIVERAAERCVIVIIEPRAKQQLLVSLTRGLKGTGFCQDRTFLRVGPRPQFDPFGLGPIVEPRPLEFLTNLLRNLGDGIRSSRNLQTGDSMLGGMLRYGIRSWNSSRAKESSRNNFPWCGPTCGAGAGQGRGSAGNPAIGWTSR